MATKGGGYNLREVLISVQGDEGGFMEVDRPIARAKESRIDLRGCVAEVSAFAIIRVSSAYWRTVGFKFWKIG